MMQHMQLLPCTKYTQSTFVDTLKGKKKAVDVGEPIGQSPTDFTARHEEDGMELSRRPKKAPLPPDMKRMVWDSRVEGID